jgi:alkanesulfonate monooxygenase SsuD/methylene tetrahydromethanopterin reductase-like flavin-dependent oxidoreductase (luciferase family)
MMPPSFKTPMFGVNVHTFMWPGIDPVVQALHAERLGFDVVTLHRDVMHGDEPSFEMWTLLTWLAARTTRITVAPLVLALPYRQPAVLAKMTETLDRLANGRLLPVLGSGAERNELAHKSFGLARQSPQEQVAALEEAIDVMRGLWSGSGFSYAGRFFRTDAATVEPKPDRAIPIWLGVFGPRMLELVGRKADGWFPTMQLLAPEDAYRKLAHIRKVAEDAGRNPDDITFAYNVPVLVENGRASTRGQIAGSAAEVAKPLAEMIAHGFTFLNFWPAGDAALQRERLAREVVPMVRELVS